ncbi:MAG TPA: ABC transporter substrate-binding protein [Terriglobales bacterium]|nr:ABC transporter substrate-binding protein [Terriglobales bacterium]
MHRWGSVATLVLACGSAGFASPAPQPLQRGEDIQITDNQVGRYGGTLVVAQRSEPKTLNPVTAADAPSREVIGRMTADLIHINRASQQTEPALAKSWNVSKDGQVFTVKLRHGLHFSDGQPFDADDVVFSFQVYLDEKVHSPQRDLLVVGGEPIEVQKIDQYTVRFTLAQPYAAAERIFDGLAMMPRHLLEKPYKDGQFAQAWTLTTPPAQIAGMGPFRMKEYVPGQKIVLERNPYYWKADQSKHRLPYLDELVFLFVGNEDAQVIRFQAGETDIISRLSAENYALLSKDAASRGNEFFDLGPSLEYDFLVFNLNDLKKDTDNIAAKQAWFQDLKFRQAVSSAIDRDSIVRLVYAGHGAALWGNVSPSNKLWVDQTLPHPARSLDRARELLKSAGFSWRVDGALLDHQGKAVEFSIITSTSNAQRTKMATLIQDDLSKLGMNVHVVPLEFRAVLDRVFQTYDYEAAIMALGGGDADPNPEMNVWLSSGGTHLWHLGESKPATEWEAQIDQFMQKQMVQLKYKERKHLYDQVQETVAANVPFVFLATPDILVGAKKSVGNFQPAILDPNTLWNVEQLYLLPGNGASAGAKP